VTFPRTWIAQRLTVAIVAVLAVLVLTGCGTTSGSSATSPSPSPTASKSQSSLAAAAALAGYLGQVKPIATQLGTTAASLPGAVKGLATKPNATWAASAAYLQTISLQLSDQAKSLAALTPPAALRAVQDAVVKGIEVTQKTVAATAATLKKGIAKKGATKAQIQAQIAALQGKLSQLPQQLISAVEGVIASPHSTPTP
jgi:hypothetical protein